MDDFYVQDYQTMQNTEYHLKGKKLKSKILRQAFSFAYGGATY